MATTDDNSSSPSSSKRRRIDASGHAAAKSLISPLLDDAPAPHDAVAFSNDGLVAWRAVKPQSSSAAAMSPSPSPLSPSPPSILVRPLLAAWKAPPLVLTAPLAHPHPGVTYQATCLQFSPSSRSLLAVFTPQLGHHLSHLHAQGIHGLACIWTRGDSSSSAGTTTSSSLALNANWRLTASWPLSEHGATPLGCGILAVRWLSDAGRASAILSADEEDGDNTSAAANNAQPTPRQPQLPGDANTASPHHALHRRRLRLLRTPSCGPYLRSKTPADPEAALLIGEDGMVHLVHRNTSIHAPIHAHNAAPFQTISAPLTAPSSATPNYGHLPLPARSRLARVAIHPLMAEEKILVASVRHDAPHRIDLTEVEVTNRTDDGIVMATRPLHAIRVQDIVDQAKGDDISGTPTLTALAFISSLTPTPTPTPTDHSHASAGTQWSESITLVVSLVSGTGSVDPTTHLATLRIKRHSSGTGPGYLCPAFASLESRKKHVADLPTESDWVATLRSVQALHARAVTRMSPQRQWDGKAWAGRIVAVSQALQGGDDLTRIVTTTTTTISAPFDPHEPQWERGDAHRTQGRYAPSPNGHLRLAIRHQGIHVLPRTVTAGQYSAALAVIARSIALALLNRRAYADVLVDSAPLLSHSADNRRAVLTSLAHGLGVSPSAQRPAHAGKGAGTYRLDVLAALLQVQRGMAAVALAANRRRASMQSQAHAQAQREIAEADWFLRIAHAHRLLSAGMVRVPTGVDAATAALPSWQCDPRAISALLPCLGFLIDECERIAREAFLLHSGAGAGAGMDTPPLTPEASAGADAGAGAGPKENSAGADAHVQGAGSDADADAGAPLLALLTDPHPHNPALPLLANTLLLSLRFIFFLRSTARPDVQQRIVSHEAERVVREYRQAEHATRWGGVGSGVGAGAGAGAGPQSVPAHAQDGSGSGSGRATASAHAPTYAYTPPQAVSAQLALARSGMEELLGRSALHYEAFVRRVASFRPRVQSASAAPNKEGEGQGKAKESAWPTWPWLAAASTDTGTGTDTEGKSKDGESGAHAARQRAAHFAQHLFGGGGGGSTRDPPADGYADGHADAHADAAAAASTDQAELSLLTWDAPPSARALRVGVGAGAPPPDAQSPPVPAQAQAQVLKNSGLHLFLAPARDFVLSLSDATGEPGGAGRGERDDVDFTALPAAGAGTGARRDVLTGRLLTRFPPASAATSASASASASLPPPPSAAPGPAPAAASASASEDAGAGAGEAAAAAAAAAEGAGGTDVGLDAALLERVLRAGSGGAGTGTGTGTAVGRVLRAGCASFTEGRGAGWGWGWWAV